MSKRLEFWRHLRIHFWTFLVILVVLLGTRNGFLYSYGAIPHELNFLPESWVIVFYAGFFGFSALITALMLTGIDLLVIYRFIHKQSFLFVLLIAISCYVLILGTLFLFLDNLLHYFLDSISGEISAYRNYYELAISTIFVLISVIVSRSLIEIDRKLGPGNLWKFLTGSLYEPKEERRLFMFIDLRSSTTIAEKLGHLKYSELISDCFHDLSIVDRFHAEVYQYVGDEVVLTWPIDKRKTFLKSLDAFWAFDQKLADKAEYYQNKYELQPIFKAGVHLGPTVVTQVGDIKREISYHGDTLNTAARIEGKCNEFEARLLISETVLKHLDPMSSESHTYVGSIPLRGKSTEVKIYKICKEAS